MTNQTNPQIEALPQPKPRRKHRRRNLLIALLLVAGLLVWNYWPSRIEIIVSPETTYITGPLNDDGTVNYVAYLDKKYAKGVTAENNAAPLLMRVIGPDGLFDEIRAKSLRRLNLPSDFFDDANGRMIDWGDRNLSDAKLAKKHNRMYGEEVLDDEGV